MHILPHNTKKTSDEAARISLFPFWDDEGTFTVVVEGTFRKNSVALFGLCWLLEHMFFEKRISHGVLNEIYLQFILGINIIFRDESNDSN